MSSVESTSMKVLGIDPGFGRMGWALVEGNTAKQVLVDVGCFETQAKDSFEFRLEQLFDFVTQTIELHQPEALAIEDLFYFKNQKTVMSVSQARGVIIVAAMKQQVKVSSYTPLQVKNTVAGYGRASKQQVQTMVKSQLRLTSAPKPDDAADACAVALTHFFMPRMQY